MSRPVNQIHRALQNQGAASENYIKTYFAYNMYFASIATTVTSTTSMQINADADFLVQEMSLFCYDLTTNAQITAPISTIQLTESNGTSFFDQAIHVLNCFGSAQLPFLLPVPRLLRSNSVLTGTLTNVVSTNAQRYMLTFHGRKIFQLG